MVRPRRALRNWPDLADRTDADAYREALERLNGRPGAMPASIHHAADTAGMSHAGTLVDGAGPPGRIGAAIAVTEFRHGSRKRGCINRLAHLGFRGGQGRAARQ
jgi:hypothetical protein